MSTKLTPKECGKAFLAGVVQGTIRNIIVSVAFVAVTAAVVHFLPDNKSDEKN